MAVNILMPALSPTMTDGTLARWLVAEGDAVRSGDVIAEIETDKATMEVEALDDGVMAKLVIAEGTQNVAVNALIAVLAEEGEDASEAAKGAENVPENAPKNAPENAPVPAPPAPVAAPTPTPAPAPTAPQAVTVQKGARIFASPLARRIAGDAGLDITSVMGTGPHGRIIRADVEEAIAKGAAAVTTSAATPTMGMAAQSERFEPHSAMRRVIAERLQQSKQKAPHFYLTVDCEIDNLLQARKALNEVAPEGVKISVNDMVVKAAAAALIAVPEVNGYFEEAGCRYFSDADICIAVAVDGGLVTPVIKAANHLGLSAIASASADLAKRARDNQLDPAEYTGGTFTISNLGMFGVREFSAVINPPQAAILAVGAGEKRPVVRGDALDIATVMSVTLSADHRIVDGAVGARWLQAFKGAIENPVTMLL
ncbi:MAG: pyruvate dehydrogenase complex dihydrolipoamide acetyltransferase [Alphaproteobacteria bacterium]|nr:pyruvate dehydrogenase complex dihydrolipoamide acetyltransferase [Alphaproteobacteria bacterium]MBL6776916.1 pyruvate dehydrogenase complex dihydrolipoamide acetyltransferase [Alphaproteobacteria bacterium]